VSYHELRPHPREPKHGVDTQRPPSTCSCPLSATDVNEFNILNSDETEPTEWKPIEVTDS
jgi:hypothetical protein